MRIGLLRHFPVEASFPSGWKTAKELHAWRERYDAAPTIVGSADLGSIPWSRCWCSDLPRALVTAQAVFDGPIEPTPLLREAEFAPFATGDLELPVWIWKWILRGAWATGHVSQRGCRDDLRRRVETTADLLERQTDDVLVVSHAGMLAFLNKELRRRGFVGPKVQVPKHAVLYVYERAR